MEIDYKKDQHFWHFITSTIYLALIILMIVSLNKLGKIPNHIPTFDFFMLALATFRITRLLVHDLVSDFVRDAFSDATYGLKLTLHDLLDCPWCTGAWVSLFVGFAYFTTPLAWPILLIMAVAGFGTLLTILASLMMVSLNGK
ncbi:MAG: hypothetical protein ACD_14C00060G0004 [uncultured bacterium]|nr:MAG: hypothetical protein ACD_14C00060G0004 [uncultured bacterium]KKQ45698.1 MAG: hypothetical protein US63_C0012G0033 [Candidatus Moranbacteria bacterium GW2011_GWC2_37_8]KKQ62840.1 MAG: hypothetical protein US82_C0005G0013 [Parcubacteria group bacterium GW2011_GWC1_38_22]